MLDKNDLNIEGNKNIVIQGCDFKDGSVNINTLDVDDLKRKLNAVKLNDYLTVFIMTSGYSKINEEIVDPIPISDYYGDNLKEWKPYGDENIIELLANFQQKSGYHLKPFLINNSDDTLPDAFFRELKLKRERSVLIVDAFSLCFEGNCKVTKIFDEPDCGGCLIPICDNHTESSFEIAYKNKVSHLKDLHHYITNFHEIMESRQKDGFVQVELHVRTKAEFFRRLTNIAIAKKIAHHINSLKDEGEIPLL